MQRVFPRVTTYRSGDSHHGGRVAGHSRRPHVVQLSDAWDPPVVSFDKFLTLMHWHVKGVTSMGKQRTPALFAGEPTQPEPVVLMDE